jgi:uncharacterized membrane protein HdeD (DUF308 family)
MRQWASFWRGLLERDCALVIRQIATASFVGFGLVTLVALERSSSFSVLFCVSGAIAMFAGGMTVLLGYRAGKRDGSPWPRLSSAPMLLASVMFFAASIMCITSREPWPIMEGVAIGAAIAFGVGWGARFIAP